MSSLLMRLSGPIQSWGTRSRFDYRSTDREPSKSGVLGLICSALGIPLEEDPVLYRNLPMGVRYDRVGPLTVDFQTAGYGGVLRAKNAVAHNAIITSHREYLTDTVFLVGLEGNMPDLERVQEALKNPTWFLTLGRRNCIPSETIWLPDGLIDQPLRQALSTYPWLCRDNPYVQTPEKLRLTLESATSGLYRQDQLLGSFEDRCFGSRKIQSEWILFPTNATITEESDDDFFESTAR